MARKNKGSALFELLYKDKGRITAPDGSLKMPGWFQGKSPPGQPAAPSAPAAASPSRPIGPKQAEPSAEPAKEPAAVSAGATVAPPPAPGPAIAPTPAAAARPAPAAKPATSLARPASVPASPPRLVPPWARTPWISLADNRVRIDVSHFAALIALGTLVCLLLTTFIVGFYSRSTKAPPAASPAKSPQDKAADAAGQPADRGIVDRAGPVGGSGGAGAGQPGGAADADEMVRGRSYVIVQSFPAGADPVAAHAAASGLADYLKAKGQDVLARQQSDPKMYLVRTRVGTDRAAAEQLAVQLVPLLVQFSNEHPRLLRFNPNEPATRPFVKTQ